MDIFKVALIEGRQQYELAEGLRTSPHIDLIIHAYPPLVESAIDNLNSNEPWTVQAVLYQLGFVYDMTGVPGGDTAPVANGVLVYDGQAVQSDLENNPQIKGVKKIPLTRNREYALWNKNVLNMDDARFIDNLLTMLRN